MNKGTIYSDMIPEVELSESTIVALRAFSVLDRVNLKHISKERALARFKTTWEEVVPFEAQWEKMRNRERIAA